MQTLSLTPDSSPDRAVKILALACGYTNSPVVDLGGVAPVRKLVKEPPHYVTFIFAAPSNLIGMVVPPTPPSWLRALCGRARLPAPAGAQVRRRHR